MKLCARYTATRIIACVLSKKGRDTNREKTVNHDFDASQELNLIGFAKRMKQKALEVSRCNKNNGRMLLHKKVKGRILPDSSNFNTFILCENTSLSTQNQYKFPLIDWLKVSEN